MKIEFIEAESVDQTGVVKKYYYAQCLAGRENTEKWALRTSEIPTEADSLHVTRRALLDLDDLQDVESAQVLAEEILSKMHVMEWPTELSPEALLFMVVNEALKALEKTAADFLLTEDSPADTLTI